MSFREKSAWIVMLTTLVIYGLYFWKIAQAAAAGDAESFHYGPLLIETVILLVIAQIVLMVVISIIRPKDARQPRDERERLIELKAVRIAFAVLSVCVLTVCCYAAFYPSSFYTTNALLLSLVLSEIVRNAGQIAYYRASL
jgi:heme/copper-type cytochrome/quinol oxidase subunit 2